MTWEESVIYIRGKPEFKELVEKAYLDERLELNVDRFIKSEEWLETLRIIRMNIPAAKNVLDIGGGNGISSIAFSLAGFDVTVVEPDQSETIGTGAIRKLKSLYKLKKLEIIEEYAEDLQIKDQLFDIVYCRQAMHHARNLDNFVKKIASLIKPGGIFFSVRDHVIFNQKDKNWFLESHPLQKLYGGENAFTSNEYRTAIKNAKLVLKKEYKYFETVINYFPLTSGQIEQMEYARTLSLNKALNKYPYFSIPGLNYLFKVVYNLKAGKTLDEKKIPGRMYSYLAVNKK